ncbi:class I SAM-dependent RNA methyltransferase [Desulfobacterota bacterium M19]
MHSFKRGKSSAARSEKIGSGPLFANFVKALTPAVKQKSEDNLSYNAPLAVLDYPSELVIKQKALQHFWNQHALPERPGSLVASPESRHYRTTSKRKAKLRNGILYLHFGDRLPKFQKTPFLSSPLEPAAHTAIYRFLQQRLSESAFRLVAGHLNYLIIRGNYEEQAVIFNVDDVSGSLIHKLKILAKGLQDLPEKVNAAFVYPDPTHSRYYLENRRPADILKFKKLFGPSQLSLIIGNIYLFHPTSFSQVNESIIPPMLEVVRELLSPDIGSKRLLDLYCGYGLFSHYLAPDYKEIIGVDAEGPSIRAAAANSRRFKNGGRRRFLARHISAQALDDLLPPALGAESVILDPPRQGPLAGVISALCRRRPQRAVHIFCGVDQIPGSLKEWRGNGYRVKEIVPLDMFPGSANLEVVVLLVPGARQ